MARRDAVARPDQIELEYHLGLISIYLSFSYYQILGGFRSLDIL